MPTSAAVALWRPPPPYALLMSKNPLKSLLLAVTFRTQDDWKPVWTTCLSDAEFIVPDQDIKSTMALGCPIGHQATQAGGTVRQTNAIVDFIPQSGTKNVATEYTNTYLQDGHKFWRFNRICTTEDINLLKSGVIQKLTQQFSEYSFISKSCAWLLYEALHNSFEFWKLCFQPSRPD